ncbi:NACHT domain-containing protein [Streptomyces meridianus]|uniref:NACHT domain-containing protein n=1 Tax=Streptomyces meridianus TaxID=2938945 RepID=A0ABT0X426_9ACTN|nr:NACHT domain-containing protein [Streptomyces meridianus]MCM2576995.1 NACHT domain-containing protein [Streptomyces meridianus]
MEQAVRLGFDVPSLGFSSTGGDGGAELSAGREQIRDLLLRLRQQAVDRKILYWTGHGEVVSGVFYLACEDSYQKGEFDPRRAVSAEELVSWLAEDPTDTLLVLDACFSGEAVREVSHHVKDARLRAGVDDAEAGFAVVATAGSRQEALEGHWVDCLERVLSDPEQVIDGSVRIFQRENAFVPFQQLMSAIRSLIDDQVPYWQEPQTLRAWFLPNPYWSPRARSALRPQDDRSWIGKELAGEELPVFSGSGESWHLRDFASRHRVLGDLINWLRVQESGMLTVTGASGAGKSTLLAYVAHLTVEHFVSSLPEDRRPRVLPELRSVNAALHCRGRTLSTLCEELTRGLTPLGLHTAEIKQGSPHSLVQEVEALAELKGSLTLMFDGLDEAAAGHSFDIARGLLNPLAALPGVRVVVATRPNARRSLPGDLRAETLLDVLHSTIVMELDQEARTEQDIARHVERLLAEENSPYRLPHAAQQRAAVARQIAAGSNGLFLVATLWARHVAERPMPSDAEQLRRELRQGTSVLDALLAEELLRLDPQDTARIRDFMTALALAQGVGLPQPRVWLAVTNAVRAPGSREYGEEDLRDVIRRAAGVTITRDVESGEEVYRLHHPSFGAHLLSDELEQRRMHRAIHRALTPRRGEDWRTTENYVKHHLTAHAALGGDDLLAELVDDCHFLVAASPDVLEPLVAARLSTTAQSALYLGVAGHFRRHPTEAARWAMLRATALAMFSREFLAAVPKPSSVFWEDVWSSAARLPLHRSWPAPPGGALAVHWEAHGDGIIHASGAGEVKSWTAEGHEVLGRDTGPDTWAAPPRQRGVTASGRGDSRVVATHDGLCVRMWHGSGRYPVEELYWGGTPGAVDSVRWGNEVLLATVDGDRLWLWRWDSTMEYSRAELRMHTLGVPVRCVSLLVAGGRAAVVTGGPTGVNVWEVPGRKTMKEPLRRVRSLRDGIESVIAVSALVLPDGGVSGSVIGALDGRALRAWRMDDLFQGEARPLFSPGPASAGRAVTVGRGPRGVLTAVGEDAAVRIWDEKGAEYVSLPCDHHHQSLAFDPSGTGRLAVADETRIRVWEPHDAPAAGDAPGARHTGRRAVGRTRLRVTGGGPGGTLLLSRSQGPDVMLSLHSSDGQTGEALRLVHPEEVEAISAARVGDRWLTAAVGRRRGQLWTLGPGLELLETENFVLPGPADRPVPSLALHATGKDRLRLLWPHGQSVVTWEREMKARGAWEEGRTFWMGAAGAVQRIEAVGLASGPSWLSAWGGNAVRVWDLTEPGTKPQPVNAVRTRAVATGLLQRTTSPVPLIAFTTGETVKFAECDGGYAVPTVLPRQSGGALDGVALAGPPQRPLLVGWSRDSGRLRLWDIRRERALEPVESRGYDVTGVDSAFDGDGITLMVQGVGQNSVRCDQVFVPWPAGHPVSGPEAIGHRVGESARRDMRSVL